MFCTVISHILFCNGAARLNVTPRSDLLLPAAIIIHSGGIPKSSGVSVIWYAAACTAGGAEDISSKNNIPAPDAGRKSGLAQTVRPSTTVGMPRRSVGSHWASRRSMTPRQSLTCSDRNCDSCLIASDLPTPDLPRRYTDRLRVLGFM